MPGMALRLFAKSNRQTHEPGKDAEFAMTEIEKNMMDFAGNLTGIWVETMSCFIGADSPENAKTRERMLLQIRDAELAKVDAIERHLGISPTTAEIRKWYKEHVRNGNGSQP